MTDHFGRVAPANTYCLCFHPIVQGQNELATEFMLAVVFQDGQSAEFVAMISVFPFVGPDCPDGREGRDEPE
jgi:hypothetical protein